MHVTRGFLLALIVVMALLAGCSEATGPSGSLLATPSNEPAPTTAPSATPPVVASPTADPTPTPTPTPAVTPPPSLRPSPSPAPTSAAPSPTATQPPVEATWRQVTDPPLDRLHQAYAVAWTGTRFVLAGIVERVVPDRSEGIAFWTSPDGLAWTMGGERSAGAVSDFAFDPSGAGVAVGYLGESATAWSSLDGVRWTKAPDQPAFLPRSSEAELRIEYVAGGDAGYVAVGYSTPHPLRAVVLMSTDGVAWTRLPSNPAFSGVRLDGIAAVGGRYVLVGHTRSPFRALFWTSNDGRTWSEMPAPPDADPTVQVAGTYQVVAGGAEWLMTLSGSDSRAWWSADGATWASAATPPGAMLRSSWQTPAIATPSGFIAVTESDGGGSNLWMSSDALTWGCVAGDHQIDGAVAASDDAIVTGDVVGDVWVADIGD